MAESFPAHLRRALNGLLHPLGLHLSRRERAFEMDGLLARAAAREPGIATWIDVGASDGSWSLRARRHFPDARFLLFEPLAERQETLETLCMRYNFSIEACAAGAAKGEVTFVIDDELDGSGVATSTDAKSVRKVRVDRVDTVVASRGLPGPYALKLDTHGYEIPVLLGSEKILPSTRLLIIEAYNFQLGPDTLRFHELCAWMEKQGFRCCDLADPMRRPGDGMLWQMDLAFAPASSPLFSNTSYK